MHAMLDWRPKAQWSFERKYSHVIRTKKGFYEERDRALMIFANREIGSGYTSNKLKTRVKRKYKGNSSSGAVVLQHFLNLRL
jgi:hypothetical protein